MVKATLEPSGIHYQGTPPATKIRYLKRQQPSKSLR